MNKYSGQDYLTFYGNHFLASKEGTELVSRLLKDHPYLADINKQIDTHNKIMQALQDKATAPKLALDSADAAFPGYVRIPNAQPIQQNTPQPQQMAPDPTTPDGLHSLLSTLLVPPNQMG